MTSPLHDKLERDPGSGGARLVVLAAIARSPEPIHGYEIRANGPTSRPRRPRFSSENALPDAPCDGGAEGLIAGTLVPSDAGPARKCFRLTDAGRRTLDTWTAFRSRTNRRVNRAVAKAGAAFPPDFPAFLWPSPAIGRDPSPS